LSSGRGASLIKLALWSSGGIALVFLLLPLLALFVSASPSELLAGLRNPLVAPALQLSLWTSLTSLVLVVGFGTPLAYALSRGHGKFARALETALALPVVIPPAVAGVALLLAFGRRGLFGRYLPDGSALAFTTAAVVAAQVFVSAPLFMQAAVAAFRRVDEELLLCARSFGASPEQALWHVALPLSAPGLVSGAAIGFARALGEFGATLMFAGSLPGRTQTLPLAIYAALESDVRTAQALSIVLVAVAFALLLVVRAAEGRAWFGEGRLGQRVANGGERGER
jgi:molybdate transport system permease protein